MSSSTSIADTAYNDPLEEPQDGWLQVDKVVQGFDDKDEDNEYNYGLPPSKAKPTLHPPSAVTLDSSQTLAFSSSKISKPSGLPIDTIAHLTHNELQHNPEFMKYVSLANSLQELLNLQEKSTTRTFVSKPQSTSSSLCPSQSASQVTSSIANPTELWLFPCPANCPDKFPHKILWTWDNCKMDPDVAMSSSSMSQPPMHKVICHEDGSMLSKVEWKAVYQSALIVACSNLASLPHTVQLMDNQPCKKMFFKHFFLMDWVKALCKLESLAPLLSLCASEYKANMTLSMVLQDNFTRFQCDAPTVPSPSPLCPPSCSSPPARAPPLMAAPLPALPSPLPLALPPHPSAVLIPLPLIVSPSSPLKRAPNNLQLQLQKMLGKAGPLPLILPSSQWSALVQPLMRPLPPMPPVPRQPLKRHHVPRPVCNKSAPKAMDVGRCARLDSNNASTQPQSKANALAPAAGAMDDAEDEGLDDGDNGLHLEDLTQDELLRWIDRHEIEAQNKQAQKEDII